MATIENSTLEIRVIKQEESDLEDIYNENTTCYFILSSPNDGLEEFDRTDKRIERFVNETNMKPMNDEANVDNFIEAIDVIDITSVISIIKDLNKLPHYTAVIKEDFQFQLIIDLIALNWSIPEAFDLDRFVDS
ncbi:14930_t:CDS:2 [Funneliformis caledonium]|uniref:14930_t:CDS:1 n=1 Tax=Funneliformis caledonium TaxID=1117310 RepID=A0A9N9GJN9_9GLOM|nr:14930_t:CDS:2 [Funneliformis caledonium]